jgi:hypothetical protein
LAKVEEVFVDSWTGLSDTINEYFTHFNNYIFRGHGSVDWKLEPTISRLLKSSDYKKREWRNAIDIHLNEFKNNVRGRAVIDFNTASDDEFWSIGQHFGLATPLLDWSRSPFVAAFFALEGCKDGDDAVIYAICEHDIERIKADKSKLQKEVNLINPLTHYNDRLVNQKGLFLYTSTNIDLEKWITSGEDQGWVTMFKIIFPSSIKNEALAGLDNMNINKLSLFPDIHGSCLHSNFQTSIEPYLEKKRNED